MPGHKGRGDMGVESADITEIDGADVLYSARGIIKQSEENASALFGTGRTLYSTEGSSLSIRAMLYLACLWGRSEGRSGTVLAAANAHKVFMSTCALLDIDPIWIRGEENTLISCHISEELLDGELKRLVAEGIRPFAVYLTSPDYLGNRLDIGALSAVCHRWGALCIVDNAHGAYLAFTEDKAHPIELGADMCADSAHKTLPALTGAAYLHISRSAPRLISEQAENAMSLFASTSPSYLILQSLDYVNKYLSSGYREKLEVFSKKLESIKIRLSALGYELLGNEALKLTVAPKSYGYYGYELGELLLKEGIVCEFCDRDFCVMMLTPEICDGELEGLEACLLNIERKAPITEEMPKKGVAKRAMSLRDALMSVSVERNVRECEGEILANAAVSCPPAVPILISGEIIDKDAMAAFEYYGIEKCFIVK